VLYMFGTYMFVRIIDRQWHCLRGIWGMSNVLTNKEGVQVVPDRDISKIRAMEDRHGVVKIVLRRLQPGAEVQILAGPLQFSFGRFIKHGRRGRVYVSLDMLGKETSIELPEKAVVAV
jgi:transcription antitermination factor NusG